ncbi:MAG: hypothetical protein LBR63_00830 [Citrobacter amalonaticus]|jgi:hypothetical protein|nr:hypothetical protein [Citrobacter amalonaticus]
MSETITLTETWTSVATTSQFRTVTVRSGTVLVAESESIPTDKSAAHVVRKTDVNLNPIYCCGANVWMCSGVKNEGAEITVSEG